MEDKFYTPREVDAMFNLPFGTAATWARKGLAQATTLPGGEIRFAESEVSKFRGGHRNRMAGNLSQRN